MPNPNVCSAATLCSCPETQTASDALLSPRETADASIYGGGAWGLVARYAIAQCGMLAFKLLLVILMNKMCLRAHSHITILTTPKLMNKANTGEMLCCFVVLELQMPKHH